MDDAFVGLFEWGYAREVTGQSALPKTTSSRYFFGPEVTTDPDYANVALAG
jgi:hypothetical protein